MGNDPDAKTISVAVEFDAAAYSLSAVKKAAYRLGDRCFTEVRTTGGTAIHVTLTGKHPKVDLERAAGDLRNEALDYSLREQIADETKGLRDLLLAQAFSATSLTDPQGEQADFRLDPLDIAKPDGTKTP